MGAFWLPFTIYCDEQLSPIYGYKNKKEIVDRPKYGSSKTVFINFHEEPKPVENTKKYESFEDFSRIITRDVATLNEPIDTENDIPSSMQDFNYKDNWKKIINEYTSKSKIVLQDVDNDIINNLMLHSNNEKIMFVFSHSGELGYASSVLSKLNISHTRKPLFNRDLILATIDELTENDNDYYYVISKTVFEQLYCDSLDKFINNIYDNENYAVLEMRKKSYSVTKSEYGDSRWIMSGIYGATHLELKSIDFNINSDKDYIEIYLVDNNNDYEIFDSEDGKIIGKSTEHLSTVLNDLLYDGDILNFPDIIKNVTLAKNGTSYIVLGLGYMSSQGY